MGRYDFDSVVDRRGSGCVKWDYAKDPDVIPMWVADMDFKAAPFIMEALQRRLDHGVFGYTKIPQGYYDSVIDWFSRRRGWKIDREWIYPVDGIVPAISICIEALCRPGGKAIINAPAYNCFYSSVRNTGRVLVENTLVLDESGALPTFRMDFDLLERQCADPLADVFLLCNPHNPTGRVWTREELVRIGEICARHGVTVISDEIHCEIEMPGHRFIPFASISPEHQAMSITFNSPSKPFNIAGLQISNMIISDPEKRSRIDRVVNTWEHCDQNPFGVAALQAAYSPEGEEWLREMNAYVWDNFCMLRDRLADELPQFRPCVLEGTYLAWLDCRSLTGRGIATADVQKKLTDEFKVWINSGTMYGDGDFMRINLATPHSIFSEGLDRIIRGLRSFA